MDIQNDKQFFDIIKNNKNVVCDFYAQWCIPCKKISPVYIELSSKFKDIKFIKVDIDKLPDLSENYKINYLPTFLIIKDVVEVERVIGMDIDNLNKLIINNIE